MQEFYNNSDLVCESDMEKIIADEDAYWEETKDEIKIERVLIRSEEYSKLFGKPAGNYISIHFDCNSVNSANKEEKLVSAISEEICFIVSENGIDSDKIFVVGLGNREIASDSFGVKTVGKVNSTRALKDAGEGNDIVLMSALTLDVFAKTGIEASEAIKGISDSIEPDIVVIVDSLVAKNSERIANTVQISDGGITPGSGVLANLKKISRESIGRAVLTIGVPTAFADLKEGKKQLFSPCDIEYKIEKVSSAVARAIEKAFLDRGIKTVSPE